MASSTKVLCSGNDLLIMKIIQIIISVLGQAITIYISYHAVKKLPKLKKLSVILKRLFYVTLICADIILSTSIIKQCLCLFDAASGIVISTCRSLIICAYNILILSLLSTLIYRLFTSFKGSVFELHISIEWTFIILFCSVVFGSIMTIISQVMVSFVFAGDWNAAVNQYPLLSGWIGAVTLMLYILISIASLSLFVFQLLKFAKFQTDIDSGEQLSKSQKKTINKTSKYAALLSIAIFTSIINAIIWIISEYLWDYTLGQTFSTKNAIIAEIGFMTTYIDVIINEVCLYLQFSAVAQCYARYCRHYQGCAFDTNYTS